jgi:putative oxidoreductase
VLPVVPAAVVAYERNADQTNLQRAGIEAITTVGPMGAATEGRALRADRLELELLQGGTTMIATPATTRNAVHANERHDIDRSRRQRLTQPTTLSSVGLLVLRLIVGLTFVMHGLDKLGHLSGARQLFASLDIPAPALAAPFVAVAETAGGVLLIAGLATPLVGAALAIDMLVALLTARLGHGFFARDGGIELEMLLGGASLGIALAGAGRRAWTPRSACLGASCSGRAV